METDFRIECLNFLVISHRTKFTDLYIEDERNLTISSMSNTLLKIINILREFRVLSSEAFRLESAKCHSDGKLFDFGHKNTPTRRSAWRLMEI